jgi:hypothetical protein
MASTRHLDQVFMLQQFHNQNIDGLFFVWRLCHAHHMTLWFDKRLHKILVICIDYGTPSPRSFNCLNMFSIFDMCPTVVLPSCIL